MEELNRRLARWGVVIPEILLPRAGTDLKKWAVIACDQFTQDRAYWEDLQTLIGAAPSTLRLIYPEVYLEDADRQGRIAAIHGAMRAYLEGGVFAPPRRCGVYLERRTPFHQRRRGLILGVDLDCYDWSPESRALIRATEGTVPERLPPRAAIRRSAPLETPHILLLVNDREDRLLPRLGELAKKAPPLYDTELLKDSGHVAGWALEGEEALKLLAAGLEDLTRGAESLPSSALPGGPPESPSSGGDPFLFAMGDGNHSLATAKAVWEERKARLLEEGVRPGDPVLAGDPSRYALVELENLYDEGIAFEPIHRLIFNAPEEELAALLKTLPGFRAGKVGTACYELEGEGNELAAAALQPLLDRFIKAGAGRYGIDYIHGKDELLRLTGEGRGIGILLPPIKKEGLFETVARSGPLPRKSFSMGEADEKRFYLECRKLSD
jgi:hypothetical protein